jgi:glycosyltransferase involved in cell wall biosynthesis
VKIALLAAGAGPRFYCENCSRDDTLERALAARGHEVAPASLYLPPPEHAPGASPPVFYGAVGLYLRHRHPALRTAPRWLGHLLDAPPFLRVAGALAGATDAGGLADLTLSMLRGEEGSQAAELDELVAWLRRVRPDAVHLSNCLLLGVARRVRRELGLPVLCTLQDEDTWIDALPVDDRAAAWELLRERSRDATLFLPVSRWYAGFMRDRLDLSDDLIAVVPVGIDVEAFPPRPGGLPFDPPVVGFLSRASEQLGAGLLADAVSLLLERGRFPGLRLRFAGGSTAADADLLASIRRRVAAAGGRVEVVPAVARADRARFLATLTALSVPAPAGEAFGTFVLESLAAAVPVVEPRAGGFTELVEDTGGGVLCEPGSAASLADALEALLADRDRARTLGRRGREAVRSRYGADAMAAGVEAAAARSIEIERSRR